MGEYDSSHKFQNLGAKCIKVTYTKLYAVCWTLLDYVKLADFAKLQKNVAAVPFTKIHSVLVVRHI